MSGAVPPLGPALDFLRAVWELDHELQRASKRMARRLGVTGPQRLVVRIVARFPGITAGQLAELLHVHPSTLTGVLRRLQRKGLVSRRSDPRDLRRAAIGVTEKGRRVHAARAGTIEAAVERLIAGTPSARLAATRRVLADLARTLAEYG